MKLKSYKKSMVRLGSKCNMTCLEYIYAVLFWAKIVKQKDGCCVICGSKEGLNAHHILYKVYHPKLSLNINNGAALCKIHHQEVHKLNPIIRV